MALKYKDITFLSLRKPPRQDTGLCRPLLSPVQSLSWSQAQKLEGNWGPEEPSWRPQDSLQNELPNFLLIFMPHRLWARISRSSLFPLKPLFTWKNLCQTLKVVPKAHFIAPLLPSSKLLAIPLFQALFTPQFCNALRSVARTAWLFIRASNSPHWFPPQSHPSKGPCHSAFSLGSLLSMAGRHSTVALRRWEAII